MKPSLIQYRALQRAGALYLKLISDDIYVSKNKQTASFEISSNTTWDITDIPEWITIGTEDINNNTGNKIISIEISANSVDSYRAHELVIVSSNKALTTKVPITQLGTPDIPYLNINPTSKSVPYTASNFQFSVDSNIMFYIEYTDPPIHLTEIP